MHRFVSGNTGRKLLSVAATRRRNTGAAGEAGGLLLRQGAGAGARRLVRDLAGGAHPGVLPTVHACLETRPAGARRETGPRRALADGRTMPVGARSPDGGAHLLRTGAATRPALPRGAARADGIVEHG